MKTVGEVEISYTTEVLKGDCFGRTVSLLPPARTLVASMAPQC